MHLPPPSAQSFLDGARRYINAACILIDARAAVDAIGLVASHGLELALKAFLLQAGRTPDELRRRFGHDLDKLWSEAVRGGLPVERDPPYWLAVLSFMHDGPRYLYRYPTEGVASAIPAADTLGETLRNVFSVVETAVRET